MKTKEILESLRILKDLKMEDLNQEELLEIYELEKKSIKLYSYHSCYEHPLLKPTSCPNCGNYRVDHGGIVFECPQRYFCSDKWDRKLTLRM